MTDTIPLTIYAAKELVPILEQRLKILEVEWRNANTERDSLIRFVQKLKSDINHAEYPDGLLQSVLDSKK